MTLQVIALLEDKYWGRNYVGLQREKRETTSDLE